MDAVGTIVTGRPVTAEEGTGTNLYALRLTVGKLCESESAPDLALTPRRFEYDTSSLGMKGKRDFLVHDWCTISCRGRSVQLRTR
jgi:hypothetical protein